MRPFRDKNDATGTAKIDMKHSCIGRTFGTDMSHSGTSRNVHGRKYALCDDTTHLSIDCLDDPTIFRKYPCAQADFEELFSHFPALQTVELDLGVPLLMPSRELSSMVMALPRTVTDVTITGKYGWRGLARTRLERFMPTLLGTFVEHQLTWITRMTLKVRASGHNEFACKGLP